MQYDTELPTISFPQCKQKQRQSGVVTEMILMLRILWRMVCRVEK